MGRVSRPQERRSRRLIFRPSPSGRADFFIPYRSKFHSAFRRAALAALAAMSLLAAAPAAADVLVSNIDQTIQVNTTLGRTGVDLAQQFTTGASTDGYTLESVELNFGTAPVGVSVKIATGVSASSAGTEVATLSNPSSLTTGEHTFTAPASTTLSANTSYWVVVQATEGGLRGTFLDNEDSGGAAGWSIDNNSRRRDGDETGGFGTSSTASVLIRVNGSAVGSSPPDTAPDFGTATVANQSYTQNAAITNLVLPEATGGNGALTYALTPALPAGLTFTASTRTISGTPTAVQAATTYTYKVTDADTNTADSDAATLTFTIAVAKALTGSVLVSNIGQTTNGAWDLRFHDLGQKFTTGSNPAGYILTSVEWLFSDATGTDLRVRVHQDTPTGTVVATLTNPSSLAAGALTFTAPAETRLVASTAYVVVLDSTTTGGINIAGSGAEDAGGASGWSISDTDFSKLRSGGSWTAGTTAFKIRVNGVVANNAPTVANEIPDQAATAGTAFSFQFAANAFADADTGATLTYSATKSDGTALPDWLTFTANTRTFSGTPAASNAGTLSVKVTASDGAASVSDTFDIVVVAVNNAPTVANEIPDQAATAGLSSCSSSRRTRSPMRMATP